jgi:hypothetical protein
MSNQSTRLFISTTIGLSSSKNPKKRKIEAFHGCDPCRIRAFMSELASRLIYEEEKLYIHEV